MDRCSLLGMSLSVNEYKLSGRSQIEVTYFKVPPLGELTDTPAKLGGAGTRTKLDPPKNNFSGKKKEDLSF